SAELELIPQDSSSGYALEDLRGAAFRGLDQAVSQAHVDAYYRVATAVADALMASPGGIERLLGECANDASAASAASCVEGFVRRAGALAIRRPLDDAEVEFLRDVVYGDGAPPDAIDAAGVRDLLVALLS